MRYLIWLAIVAVMASEAWPAQDYFSSRVGCFSRLASTVGVNCTEQRLAMKALKALHQSNRKASAEKLARTIHKRADYFLAKREFDYFVVVSYMLFKVEGAETKLNLFKDLPGKRAPFADIALTRMKNERSSYCEISPGEKSVAIFLREICSLDLQDI